MDPMTLLALFLATLIFALSPGPGVLAVAAASTRHGFGAGVMMALGMVVGDLAYLMLALLSLGALADILAPVMTHVRMIGAGYLIYLGVRLFLTAGAPRSTNNHRPAAHYGLAGFLISGTNPKVVIFYLSFLPLFVDLTHMTPATTAQVALTIGVTVLLALTGVSTLGSRLGSMFQRPRLARRIDRLAGTAMIGVGLTMTRS